MQCRCLRSCLADNYKRTCDFKDGRSSYATLERAVQSVDGGMERSWNTYASAMGVFELGKGIIVYQAGELLSTMHYQGYISSVVHRDVLRCMDCSHCPAIAME
jgi:hypothetical protein